MWTWLHLGQVPSTFSCLTPEKKCSRTRKSRWHLDVDFGPLTAKYSPTRVVKKSNYGPTVESVSFGTLPSVSLVSAIYLPLLEGVAFADAAFAAAFALAVALELVRRFAAFPLGAAFGSTGLPQIQTHN